MRLFRIGLFVVLVAAVSLPALAQTQLEVNIPFNFVVAGKTLPAGHYRVVRASDTDMMVWSIVNRNGSAYIHTNPLQSPFAAHRASLIFWHSGGEYTLARFWPDEHLGQELVLRKPAVKSTLLAKSGEYVEIGAE